MEFKIVKTTDKFKEGNKYFEKEKARLAEIIQFEKKWYTKGFELIAGIDEAGRGPLAGPVVAGAVILPKGLIIEGVNDSKKLSEKKRDTLYSIIVKEALCWGVGIVDNNIIDEINVLNAAKMAMKIAVSQLKFKPEVLLIDAEKLDIPEVRQEAIIKGDAKSISIAAASIIAKVTRDRIIEEYDKKFPDYGFAKHKGYGTAEHMEAIREKGLCEIHRKTFTKNIINN
ncbi:MAG: ribonuclease HII [Ignavibacteriales bacterium]